MSRKILFITPQTIKERSGLHTNVDEKLVNPEIMTAQDMFIHPALGTGLYNRLQDGIELNDLTDAEQTLLDTYVTPALVYQVLSELPMGMSFQFYNKGVVRKTGTDQSDPTMQDLIDVANRYKARAEFYMDRMVRYLRQQATTTNDFPTYLNPGTGADIIVPQKEPYSISIYLGDDFDCCDSKDFEKIYQGNIPRCGCNGK